MGKSVNPPVSHTGDSQFEPGWNQLFFLMDEVGCCSSEMVCECLFIEIVNQKSCHYTARAQRGGPRSFFPIQPGQASSFLILFFSSPSSNFPLSFFIWVGAHYFLRVFLFCLHLSLNSQRFVFSKMENAVEEVDVGGLPGVAEELPEANDAIPGSKEAMELLGEDISHDGNDEEELDVVEALAKSGDRASTAEEGEEVLPASGSLPGAGEQDDLEGNVEEEGGEEAHEKEEMDVEVGKGDAKDGMDVEDETEKNLEKMIPEVVGEREESGVGEVLHQQDSAAEVLDEYEKEPMISESNATNDVKEEMEEEEGLTEQQSDDAPVVEVADVSLATRVCFTAFLHHTVAQTFFHASFPPMWNVDFFFLRQFSSSSLFFSFVNSDRED
jgi:hypothetical protein